MTIFSSLLSLVNVAVILLTATFGCPRVANALSVQLFAESDCPAGNPGPICTNLPELTCCRDHVGDIANYYTSARFEGLQETEHALAAWTWNVDSKCGKIENINQYRVDCFNTLGSNRDGYGVYWAISNYSQDIPLPTSRAFVNGSDTVAALAASFPKCERSVAPDVYHIKLSADSLPIPISRPVALKMMASDSIKRNADAFDIGKLVDRETGVVKAEKLSVVQKALEKYGNGITDEQIQAVEKLRR